MAITPEDIQHQEFQVRLRGFDMDEVDTFLEQVAEELYALLRENDQLRERIRELEQGRGDRTAGQALEKAATEEKLIALQERVRDELRATLNWYLEQLDPAVSQPVAATPGQEPAALPDRDELFQKMEMPGLEPAPRKAAEPPGPDPEPPPEPKKPEAPVATAEHIDPLFGPETLDDDTPEPAITFGGIEDKQDR
ncbi:MAG: DivIVA domain-containing protein [Desulfobacterales bacterium]|nr:DivIVA domain-containing protein [Desulfobacterales bacterium]